MAGVEPASEEKTIQTTTYVVCLSLLAPPNPTDRILEEPTREAPLAARFAVRSQVTRPASLRVSASLWNPAGRTPRDGLPNHLGSQCVVAIGTCVFSALFTCNAESTVCVPNHPHPRRSQFIPSPVTYCAGGRKATLYPPTAFPFLR